MLYIWPHSATGSDRDPLEATAAPGPEKPTLHASLAEEGEHHATSAHAGGPSTPAWEIGTCERRTPPRGYRP
eukprot:4360950-Pyramimonas_sp.AAC.1